jgi:tetratricopeptide (TPR) repeat protein
MPSGEPQSQKTQSGPDAARARATRELRKAEKLAERGQVAEAIQSLDVAMRHGADRYTCYLRQSRLYQTCRRWDDAFTAAEKAIAEDPEKLSAREAVIALCLERRDYARAVDASKALLRIAPRHVPARDALGAAYIGLGDIHAAIRVTNDLIRLDPANAAHRFNKAHLCQHLGEVGAAIEEFERVVHLASDTELATAAMDQIEALDTFQIQQILTLGFEDAVFRARLLRDSTDAAASRGYTLSETGRSTLEQAVTDLLQDLPAAPRALLYH